MTAHHHRFNSFLALTVSTQASRQDCPGIVEAGSYLLEGQFYPIRNCTYTVGHHKSIFRNTVIMCGGAIFNQVRGSVPLLPSYCAHSHYALVASARVRAKVHFA